MSRVLYSKKFLFQHLIPYCAATLFIFILFNFIFFSFGIGLYDQRKLELIFRSSCSSASDRRGLHQKVIAYSIYGNFSQKDVVRKYLNPLKITIDMIPVIYPGWIVRIYHNLTMDDTTESAAWKILRNTLESTSHVDFCNITEVIEKMNLDKRIFAMTWRWLPLLDEMVDFYMSRDADSHIIPREKHAVLEWLTGDQIFHIMRDHPLHCTSMLGGMWGAKISQDRLRIKSAFEQIFKTYHEPLHGYDQFMLTRYVWPLARSNMIAHDSYCCEQFPLSKPFPTKRKSGLFVGGRDLQEEELKYPCPTKCRPPDFKSDWTFC